MSMKEEFINNIIDIEGGYVNDPKDSGGATNWGITEHVARANGYQGHMRDLPRSLAFSIYSSQYWDSIQLTEVEKLSPLLAGELADTGVNQGTGRAAEFLQRSLNVLNDQQSHYPDLVVDKSIGRMTLNALRAYLKKRGLEGERVLFNMLNCLQGAFYVELAERREKDERFMFGWYLHRVGLSKTGVPLPDNKGITQTKETSMDDTKSIFQSKTFYGIIVSVIAKALTMYFGVEVDDETQSQMLQMITTVIGLGGDAFALYGRLKAKKTVK